MKAVATGVLLGLPAVGAYESILGVDLPRFHFTDGSFLG